MGTKLPHAADEQYEGLQLTTELERRQQSCAHVDSSSSYDTKYHTSITSSSNRASVTQATQQANHDHDGKKVMTLKQQRLQRLLLLLWRRGRPPHQRTSVE